MKSILLKIKNYWIDFQLNNTGVKRFPFDNFTYCLTLFSKFFSSFPHGTCSLSVSRQYLALDEIYHPFWTAFPNNPTLWKCITQLESNGQIRDSHPLWCPIPKNFCHSTNRKHFYKLQFVKVEPWRFQIWALPASLAVTKGILVSFFSSAYWYA